MGIRRTLLTALPKIAISRVTGWLTGLPLPRRWRRWVYGRFARRYGAELAECAGELTDYRSLAAFFGRPLRDGARPVADDATTVWPCDGRIVTAGPIENGRIPQVKGVDYTVAELLDGTMDASTFAAGSQATIYLAPGDYHRVHAPFAARVRALHRIRGTLFPVNPPTVRSVPKVFVRNARVVFELELEDGSAATVVMVGALNVGHIAPSVDVGDELRVGDELGRFGFGSTTVVVHPSATAIPAIAPETVGRMGQALR